MNRNIHPISCVNLTKPMLNEILSEPGYSYNAVLVSPMGNVFILGDTEDYEIFEVAVDTEDYEQYVIIDAGNASRTIMFHGDNSDYGVLIGPNGVATSTTGVSQAESDDAEFKEFVKYETGQLGQECAPQVTQIHDESSDDEIH